MSQKEHFRVSGHDLNLSKEDVQHALKTIKAQPVRKVYVKIGKKEIPVKQAFEEITKVKGLVRPVFTTQDAARVLNRLGFEIRVKEDK